MGKPYVCFYHADCLDGIFAALVVKKALSSKSVDLVEFVPSHYNDAPPDVTGKVVYIVDFSFPRKVTERMIAQAERLTVIDHHQSAQKALQGLPGVIFDMERSGAGLTWAHFFPDKPIPPVIEHVEDRDLWRFSNCNTEAVCAALYSLGWDFETLEPLLTSSTQPLISEGRALVRQQRKDVARLLTPAYIRWGTIGGHPVPIINCNRQYASDVGNALSKTYPFAATYVDTARGREFSLRSSKNNSLHRDVAQIAETYGGGGHRHAAGFTVPYGHPLTAGVWANDLDE